jgi:hypothetical protein
MKALSAAREVARCHKSQQQIKIGIAIITFQQTYEAITS